MYPSLLLRLEGTALFLCAAFFYHSLRASWILFVALFLWPDILMLGYLVNAKLGSRFYNLVHTDVLPAALAASSYALHQPYLLAFALIWLGHIGLDRALGYGLKYPTFFKDTHLQRL
jgi:hypothetical protein